MRCQFCSSPRSLPPPFVCSIITRLFQWLRVCHIFSDWLWLPSDQQKQAQQRSSAESRHTKTQEELTQELARIQNELLRARQETV